MRHSRGLISPQIQSDYQLVALKACIDSFGFALQMDPMKAMSMSLRQTLTEVWRYVLFTLIIFVQIEGFDVHAQDSAR